MLVNSELYTALREAGASHEKAGAAAAIVAEHELQFSKLKALRIDILRYIAIVAVCMILGTIAYLTSVRV